MTTLENLKKCLKEIEKNDQKGKKINAVLQLRDKEELEKEAKEIDEKIKSGKAGKLAGKIIGVKANINVKGLNASCASKVLENYKSGYDATVVEKIKTEDGLVIGMLNMDEFACGSSGETSAFGPTKNPSSSERIPGGSSSGSAAAVSAGFCDLALGSDTGGSIRNPSSHCGVIGLKPTYSSVSRYGLIDLSMSLDQIGPIGKNIDDVALLFDVIKGRDEKDSTSQDSKNPSSGKNDNLKSIKVGVLNLDAFKIDDNIRDVVNSKIDKVVKEHEWSKHNVKIENVNLGLSTYYLMVYVEFFSGTRKFDGRRFGKKIEDFAGKEVLRRVLGGSEISKGEYKGRYYNQALKAKKVIKEEFEKAFRKYDCIVCPTVPKLPHKVGESISVEEMYSYDALTVLTNLAGNCAISIPAGNVEGIPVGVQIICDKFEEQKLFSISRKFE